MRVLAMFAALAMLWSTTQAGMPPQDGRFNVHSVLTAAADLTPTPDDPDDEGPSDNSDETTPAPDDADNEGPSDGSAVTTPAPDDADNEGPNDG